MKQFWNVAWHQVVISLLIGLVLGMGFCQWRVRQDFQPHWEKGDPRQHTMERFGRELNLSAEQQEKVAVIFESKHSEMKALQTEMRPKFEALRDATQTEIRKLLNPDQQKKFDEINARMEKHRKERGKPSFGRGSRRGLRPGLGRGPEPGPEPESEPGAPPPM